MTTNTAVQERTVQLDPEVARRGLLAVAPIIRLAWVSGWALGFGMFFALQGGVSGAAVCFILGVGTMALTYEWPSRGSYAARGVHRWRETRRRRPGLHVYWSYADRGDYTGVPSDRYVAAADPAWEVPAFLGNTAPVDLTGTGFDDLFLVRHNNPAELEYLSIAVQVEGLPGGLRSNASYAASSQLFGLLEAEIAKPASLLRGIQGLHRSVPYDMNPHTNWYIEKMEAAEGEMDALIDSYGQVIDTVGAIAEEHRAWYVLKFPVDDQFIAEAATRDQFGDYRRAEVGWASVIKDELERFERLARDAGLGEVTVLGERRTCAVIRALQDPSFALDDDRDVDWHSCWQSYVGGRYGYDEPMEVNGRWYTRTAEIPRGAIAPRPLGPLWLHPLLVGVEADPGSEDSPRSATIRTVSVRIDGVPDYVARAKATDDLASDGATKISERKKGKVSDGTSDVMMSGSARRNADLAPGSGHHGIRYAIALSVTARSPDDLRRACGRVTSALGSCAITDAKWHTDRHDVGQVLTLPLCRGLAGTKDARTA